MTPFKKKQVRKNYMEDVYFLKIKNFIIHGLLGEVVAY